MCVTILFTSREGVGRIQSIQRLFDPAQTHGIVGVEVDVVVVALKLASCADTGSLATWPLHHLPILVLQGLIRWGNGL